MPRVAAHLLVQEKLVPRSLPELREGMGRAGRHGVWFLHEPRLVTRYAKNLLDVLNALSTPGLPFNLDKNRWLHLLPLRGTTLEASREAHPLTPSKVE